MILTTIADKLPMDDFRRCIGTLNVEPLFGKPAGYWFLISWRFDLYGSSMWRITVEIAAIDYRIVDSNGAPLTVFNSECWQNLGLESWDVKKGA